MSDIRYDALVNTER